MNYVWSFCLGEGNTSVDVTTKVEAGHVDALPGDASGLRLDAHSDHYRGIKKGDRQHILTQRKIILVRRAVKISNPVHTKRLWISPKTKKRVCNK